MNIAVTGEGKTDYGIKEYGSMTWKWGPIAYYIKKIANEQGVEVALSPISREDIRGFRLQRSVRACFGHEIPARKFAYLMKERGYKNGVFYCDTDKSSRTKNSEIQGNKEFDRVHSEVVRGLDVDGIDAIPMVALRMIEAWIMGDKKAIENAMDITIPGGLFPSAPERLWGDEKNPFSDFPKNFFARMIAGSDKKYRGYSASMEDFCNIAESTDIETLRRNCPISFEKFYEDFVEMLKRQEKS